MQVKIKKPIWLRGRHYFEKGQIVEVISNYLDDDGVHKGYVVQHPGHNNPRIHLVILKSQATAV